MGLFYIMPAKQEEGDRVVTTEDGLVLKSYGPAYLFWAYYALFLGVLLAMGLVIHQPLMQMIAGEDQINRLLALSMTALLVLVPLVALLFLLYEKQIVRRPQSLVLNHSILGLVFFKRVLPLGPSTNLEVMSFFNSPNIAKKRGFSDRRAYYNHGYFLLGALDDKGKWMLLDRSTSRGHLESMRDLLLKNQGRQKA